MVFINFQILRLVRHLIPLTKRVINQFLDCEWNGILVGNIDLLGPELLLMLSLLFVLYFIILVSWILLFR